jgi:hypothetical protein
MTGSDIESASYIETMRGYGATWNSAESMDSDRLAVGEAGAMGLGLMIKLMNRTVLLALLLSLFFINNADAAFSLVSKNRNQLMGTSTSVTVTLPSITAAPNRVVSLMVGWCAPQWCNNNNATATAGVPTITATDTAGNVFTNRKQSPGNKQMGFAVLTAPVTNSRASTDTFTVSFSASAAYPLVGVMIWDGVDSAAPSDVSASGAISGTSLSMPLTTTVANDLILAGAYTCAATGVGPNQTIQNAHTGDGQDETSEIATTSGVHNQSFNSTGSCDTSGVAIALKSSAAPVAQQIASTSLSSNTLLSNSPANTVIGNFATAMSPTTPAFSGSYNLGCSGADNASFNISGADLRNNAALPARNYAVCVVTSQAGSASINTPFTITVSDPPPPSSGNPFAISWRDTNPGVPLFIAPRNMVVTKIAGLVQVATGTAVTIDVFQAPSDANCSSGTKLNATSFNANGAQNKIVDLGLSANVSIPMGNRVCLTTNPSNWNGAGVGSITVTAN